MNNYYAIYRVYKNRKVEKTPTAYIRATDLENAREIAGKHNAFGIKDGQSLKFEEIQVYEN